MSGSTDLTTQYDADVAALIAQQEEDLGDVQIQTPILKVTQALTTEVKNGDAEAGEFYNTLTGESYGSAVEFIVAYYQPGRAASEKGGRYYVAIGQDLIPESWADLVGDEWVGQPFSEHPDAEEQYKKRVNAKEIEWGKGPLISTTYNYTGLVLPPAIDGEDDPEPMPVRISFLRTTKSASDKIQTLKKALLRGKPFWDLVFRFETKSKSFGRNDAFIVNVSKTRATDSAEKLLAVELAQAVVGGRTADNAEAAEAGSAPVAPDNNGGLAV